MDNRFVSTNLDRGRLVMAEVRGAGNEQQLRPIS